MRKLKVRDIKPAIRLKKIMNCGEKLTEILESEPDIEKAGSKIIGMLLDLYEENSMAEDALAMFLAGPFERTPEEVLDMDLDELMDGIKEIGGFKAVSVFFDNVPG